MSATIQTTTPNPNPEYSGMNLSPLQPLEDLKNKVRVPNKNKLCEAIRELYEEYSTQDEQPRRDAIDIGKMIANLTAGKLKMLRHPITNRYAFVKKDTAFEQSRTVGGVFQYYRTKLDAEWLGSKPDRDPICPSNDDQIEEFIEGVKVVQDYYNRKFYTDRLETEESHSAQEYGTYIWRYRYDPQIDDIVAELLDFPACAYDVRFMAEESPFFIYYQKIATKVLSKMVGGEVEEDNGEEIYGLQIIEEIARQGGGVSGFGKDRDNDGANTVKGETVVTEFWMQPDCYCDIELDEDTKTVSGQTLKEGTMLIDAFPNGLVALGINGMKTIIGLYPENHREHIVSGVYHYQSFSGIGKGVNDAVDVKKEMDDLYSQTMAYVKARGTPAYGYNQSMITEEQARNIGKPRKNIPIDFTQAPDGVTSVNQAIQAIQPQNPASGMNEMGFQLNNWLQLAFQVTQNAELPGVDSKTATGDRIRSAQQQIMLVPQHRYKADQRKRADKVIYNLFRKFKNTPRFFETKDKNGITKGIYVSGKDFADIDIEFEVVLDSEVPKTPYSKEESMGRLLMQTGGVMGLLEAAATNPEITGKIVQVYGADLPIAKTNDVARVCRKRINQIKKLIAEELEIAQVIEATVGIQADNSNLAKLAVDSIQPPITTKEPYHQLKMMWISQLLDADEMMYESNEVRQALAEMCTRHIQMDTMNGIEIGQAQNIQAIMAELPNIVAGQLQQAQQMEMAQGQQAQQQQLADAKGQKEKAANEQAEAVKHQRAKELNQQSQNNAMQLKATDALTQMNAPKQKAA